MKRLINKHADGLIGHLNTLRSATVPSALRARRSRQPSWQRTLYATHTGRTLTHPEQINNVASSHALHTRSMWRKLTNLNIFRKEHRGDFGQVQYSYFIVYRSYCKSWAKLCLKGPYWAYGNIISRWHTADEYKPVLKCRPRKASLSVCVEDWGEAAVVDSPLFIFK